MLRLAVRDRLPIARTTTRLTSALNAPLPHIPHATAPRLVVRLLRAGGPTARDLCLANKL